MAYMLLIVEDPAQRDTRTRAEGEAVFQRMVDFAEDLKKQDKLLAVESLAAPKTGSRVEVRGGKAPGGDGPFAEGKEMVGGFLQLGV
ncbi:MAG: YciI family protein, partial [Burkholderiales bacterium]